MQVQLLAQSSPAARGSCSQAKPRSVVKQRCSLTVKGERKTAREKGAGPLRRPPLSHGGTTDLRTRPEEGKHDPPLPHPPRAPLRPPQERDPHWLRCSPHDQPPLTSLATAQDKGAGRGGRKLRRWVGCFRCCVRAGAWAGRGGRVRCVVVRAIPPPRGTGRAGRAAGGGGRGAGAWDPVNGTAWAARTEMRNSTGSCSSSSSTRPSQPRAKARASPTPLPTWTRRTGLPTSGTWKRRLGSPRWVRGSPEEGGKEEAGDAGSRRCGGVRIQPHRVCCEVSAATKHTFLQTKLRCRLRLWLRCCEEPCVGYSPWRRICRVARACGEVTVMFVDVDWRVPGICLGLCHSSCGDVISLWAV